MIKEMVTKAERVSLRSSSNQIFSNFNILEFSIPPKLKGKISDSKEEWKVHNTQIKDIWRDTNLGTDSDWGASTASLLCHLWWQNGKNSWVFVELIILEKI